MMSAEEFDRAWAVANQAAEMADPREGLRAWWHETAGMDFEMMLLKLEEYGSLDLDLQGWALRRLAALPHGKEQESACIWYAFGKAARAISAMEHGALPSDDTLRDLTIYSMMARRIRETGRWP